MERSDGGIITFSCLQSGPLEGKLQCAQERSRGCRAEKGEEGKRESGGKGRGGGEGFNVTNLRSPFGSVNPACRSRISQPPSLVSLARFLHRNLWQFCNSSHWQKISGIGARTAGGDCECTRET